MTIDSAYQLELYNPDNDREYFFEFESTGVTTFILWIDYTENGVPARVSLSPGTGDFDIEFEGRDPIYKRGKITLTDQFFQAFEGVEITRLTMQRKTPIYKDVAFEDNGAWSSEGFEFEIDKICLIQQELEGHLCACRQPELPKEDLLSEWDEELTDQWIADGGTADSLFTAAQPFCADYDCDQFAVWAQSVADGVATFYWPMTNLVTDDQIDGYNTTPPLIEGVSNYGTSFINSSGSVFPDGCDTTTHWESQYQNLGGQNAPLYALATGDNDSMASTSLTIAFVYRSNGGVAPGAFSNYSLTASVSQSTGPFNPPEFTGGQQITIGSDRNWRISLNGRDVTVYSAKQFLTYDDINVTAVDVLPAVTAEPVLITIELVGYSGAVSAYRTLALSESSGELYPFTARVYVNRDLVLNVAVNNVPQIDMSGYMSSYSVDSLTGYDADPVANSVKYRFAHAGHYGHLITYTDVDPDKRLAMMAAFERNVSGYTQPTFCTV